MMPSPKTAAVYYMVLDRMESWRFWKSVHTWLYVILGTISSAVSTFVAINAKSHIRLLSREQDWIPALLAAVLTFIISALGAQAESKAFEVGARMLESALAKFETNPDYGDKELGEALIEAIGALNKKS